MREYLTELSCCCALGRSNTEVLAHAVAHSEAGLIQVAGDIPGRKVFFGAVGGELPPIDDPEYDLRANRLLRLAVEQAGGAFERLVARCGAERVGIVLGASNTGVDEAQRHVDQWLEQGRRPAAMRFSELELGTPAAYLQRLLGTKGPAYVVSTACSSGAKAFATARRLLAAGVVDAVIVGGVDGRCRFALNGFHALGALAAARCRPLAEDRDGICLGEGVALFVMERESRPTTSRFPKRVLFAGAGETSDAYHATAPDPEGRGAEAAMRAALADAGIAPAAVGYVNLHGTGTLANDAMEMKAVRRVFGAALPRYESTKNLTGHCLGAAGAVEAAICWLLLASGEVEGAALSNSFAFGGSNAAVVLMTEEAERT